VKPWAKGRVQIRELIDTGQLEHITGAATNAQFLLDAAHKRLDSALIVQTSDPVDAFELAYAAARHAATALLVQQGLRPKSQGGHLVVINAVRAQFGDDRFQRLDSMRRTRNTLEYPVSPEALIIETEAQEAIDHTRDLIERV
jgi:uncharacterized protein (UPF0332 family)